MTDPRSAALAEIERSLLASVQAAEEGDDLTHRFYQWLFRSANPDDWHRFVSGANWDSTEPSLFQWIVEQPSCDKASAFTVFWYAQPGFYLEAPDRGWAITEPEIPFLLDTIRARWLDGRYVRSELAFELDPYMAPNLGALDRAYGGAAEAAMPSGMRAPLAGRVLDETDVLEGIPKRFWPPEFWEPSHRADGGTD